MNCEVDAYENHRESVLDHQRDGEAPAFSAKPGSCHPEEEREKEEEEEEEEEKKKMKKRRRRRRRRREKKKKKNTK